jgi:hypothetical protein
MTDKDLLLTDEEILAIPARSIHIRQLNETIEDVQAWNRQQVKELFAQKLAKAIPVIKAEAYRAISERVKGVENPYKWALANPANRYDKCRAEGFAQAIQTVLKELEKCQKL